MPPGIPRPEEARSAVSKDAQTASAAHRCFTRPFAGAVLFWLLYKEVPVRPASAALQAYLAANDTFIVIDLYTFALPSGAVLRYSGWTAPLTIPGTAFAAGSLNYDAAGYTEFALGPRFDRSMVTTKIGIEPTELDIAILAGAEDLVGG